MSKTARKRKPVESELGRLERNHPFKLGQRVKLSAHGEARLSLRKRGKNGKIRGTVTALGPTVLGVSVWIDNYARPMGFFSGFWESSR